MKVRAEFSWEPEGERDPFLPLLLALADAGAEDVEIDEVTE